MRDRHIKWITNAKVTKIEAGKMHVTEFDDMGKEKRSHELPFKYSMMLPAFKGIDAVFGIEGLTNPRGFILIDQQQRNPKYKNIYAVGVCVAIPPVEQTPVPTGAPKTGYMIESMVEATAANIRAELDGKQPEAKATWNAVCLADFGDTGVAFVALPQIPPRNVNWFAEGKWVHLGKVAFERYFMRKMKTGATEPLYEKLVLHVAGDQEAEGCGVSAVKSGSVKQSAKTRHPGPSPLAGGGNIHSSPSQRSSTAMGISGRVAAFFQASQLTPLIALVLFLLGLFAVLITPKEEEPQINVTMANVFVPFPGASARDVENLVASAGRAGAVAHRRDRPRLLGVPAGDGGADRAVQGRRAARAGAGAAVRHDLLASRLALAQPRRG